MTAESTIGAAARKAGCSVPTVRYYEQIGLLNPANRTASGHRTYVQRDIQSLRLIRRCRDFGMPIKDIAVLIAVDAGPSDCSAALTLINSHRTSLRTHIAELKSLERELALMAERCSDTCLGGTTDCCTIYSDLSVPR